jgi:hypothetical protein
MSPPVIRVAILALLLLGSNFSSLRADVVLPGNILNPGSAPEAWNVIRLATKNVDKLLAEKRLTEVPGQISFCSPALRALARFPESAEGVAQVEAKTARAMISVNAIARAGQENNPVGAQAALASLRIVLGEIARHFDSKVVEADIFFCPMHPDFVSADANAPCGKCGRALLPRRIPYSFIYTKPGEPTMRMTATASGPVEAGQKIDVKMRLEKTDKSPVLSSDLARVHTEFIHLLIENPGLSDYHLVHPKATGTPGEYFFSFTPKKTAPYRVWADIVPLATGVQELPFVDLPSNGQAEPVTDTGNRFTSSAGGYQFELLLVGGNHLPTKARQARRLSITVTQPDGTPATSLEPVMNAFAHLVGFYGDYQTVVHLHPTGGDILNQELRGGPSLSFMFFPPKPGFIRLYCLVMIDGQRLFAPFNLNVEP